MTTCYACEEESTSAEHVPPKCVFPHRTWQGKSLRKNLITVPSCDAHNLAKSKDDEFFRAVLIMISASNSKVAESVFWDKLLRAAGRRPIAHSQFFKSDRSVNFNGYVPLKIDRVRFNACISNVVRGLAYHHYGLKWKSEIAAVSPELSIRRSGSWFHHDPLTETAVAQLRELLAPAAILGDNPDVFRYRIHHDDTYGLLAFAGLFYGVTEVFCSSFSKALVSGA